MFCLTILAKEQPGYGQQSCQYGTAMELEYDNSVPRSADGLSGASAENIEHWRSAWEATVRHPDVGGPVILKIHQYIFVGKYKTDYRLQHECSAHNTAVAMLPDSDHDSRKGAPIEKWTVRCKPEQPRIRRILNEKQECVWDEGGETEYGSKHEESCAEDP